MNGTHGTKLCFKAKVEKKPVTFITKYGLSRVSRCWSSEIWGCLQRTSRTTCRTRPRGQDLSWFGYTLSRRNFDTLTRWIMFETNLPLEESHPWLSHRIAWHNRLHRELHWQHLKPQPFTYQIKCLPFIPYKPHFYQIAPYFKFKILKLTPDRPLTTIHSPHWYQPQTQTLCLYT